MVKIKKKPTDKTTNLLTDEEMRHYEQEIRRSEHERTKPKEKDPLAKYDRSWFRAFFGGENKEDEDPEDE